MKPGLNLSLKFVKESKATEIMMPLEFENHISLALGENYARDLPNAIKDLELKDVQHLFLRYLTVLKKKCGANIKSADSFLMDQIEDTIVRTRNYINRAKSVSEVCFIMIAALGEINFRTLGVALRLDQNYHYSIHYSQSIRQKADLICDYIQDRASELYEEINTKRTVLRNDEKFITWIKSDEKFSEIYLKLF